MAIPRSRSTFCSFLHLIRSLSFPPVIGLYVVFFSSHTLPLVIPLYFLRQLWFRYQPPVRFSPSLPALSLPSVIPLYFLYELPRYDDFLFLFSPPLFMRLFWLGAQRVTAGVASAITAATTINFPGADPCHHHS